MRHFNITGLCTPEQDYMADISEKIKSIRAMTKAGEYFAVKHLELYQRVSVSCKQNL